MNDATEPATIRVMVFNIEYGGTGVDLDKVIEAIRLADPDVVALEEAMGNTARIAAALGWPSASASARTHVLSRHPLHEPADADGLFVYVEIEPGRIVSIVNVHLPAEPFGPALLAAGGSDTDAQTLEKRVRLPALERPLAALAPLAAAGIPVFMLGDFNAPLDLGWPVSRAIEAAGLRDTWREIHPDPFAEPGLTWPAARPAIGRDDPVKGAREDRIDAIYAAGPSTTLDCRIVGESGRRDIALSVDPWPSDHRAIVATFRVWPAPMPRSISPVAKPDAGSPVKLQSSQHTYRVGEPIEVTWANGPANRWDWIAVFAAPAEELRDRDVIWLHTGARVDGSLRLDGAAAIVDQSPAGGHWPLPPGDYEVAYLLDDAHERVARAAFTIVETAYPETA